MHGDHCIIPTLASQQGKQNMINRLAASEHASLRHKATLTLQAAGGQRKQFVVVRKTADATWKGKRLRLAPASASHNRSLEGNSPLSLLSSTRMISLSRCAGVWLTTLWTERRITDRASFTKMKTTEICGRSSGYVSCLHLS